MSDKSSKFELLMAGDQGLVVDFGNEISASINRQVQQLVKALTARQPDGILEVIPTYRSVMIYFDPILITRSELAVYISKAFEQIGANDSQQTPRRVIHVPVCYGGVFGPDMDFVVRHTGLSAEEVIQIHTGQPYLIYMLGFTPGFPYLGGLPEKLIVPRLKKLRTKIPEGSVGIAGKQTGFYTVQSTGGWRIIGRTPIKAFNPDNNSPFFFTSGDYLQFESVTVDEFFEIYRQVELGTYIPEITSMTDDDGVENAPG